MTGFVKSYIILNFYELIMSFDDVIELKIVCKTNSVIIPSNIVN